MPRGQWNNNDVCWRLQVSPRAAWTEVLLISPCSSYIRSLILAQAMEEQSVHVTALYSAVLENTRSRGLTEVIVHAQPSTVQGERWVYHRLTDSARTSVLDMPPFEVEFLHMNSTSLSHVFTSLSLFAGRKPLSTRSYTSATWIILLSYG
ncbi:hypothetical protein BKA93DRAFT_306693 [Sparassis latifolia]